MNQNKKPSDSIVSVIRDSDNGINSVQWSWGDKDATVLTVSELRRAELKVLGSDLDDKRGFLRELLLDVEMELDDHGAIEYLEDQIARCFEEEDFHDLEHYKSQILDLMMRSLGLPTYERMHEHTKPVKKEKR